MDFDTDIKNLSKDLFFVRGTTISLVVLFHVLGGGPDTGLRGTLFPDRIDLGAITEFIDSFNMDVMFIGSGVAVSLFGQANRSFSVFLKKKLNKLLIPMLVWAPIFLLVNRLSKAIPHELREWMELLAKIPTAWSPSYSIFWFIHCLIWCTFLFWIFRRVDVRERLGPWQGPVYLVLALLLRTLAAWWKTRSPGELIGIVEFFLYYNIFFAIGVLIHPYLLPLRKRLQSMPRWVLALIPIAFFLEMLVHWQVYPAVHRDRSFLLDGPLAFCMELSLAVLVRETFLQWGGMCEWLQRQIVFMGSISIIIYIFHIYFTSGTRILLVTLVPGLPLAAHLVVGWFVGIAGPLLLFRTFKDDRAFRWSVGVSKL